MLTPGHRFPDFQLTACVNRQPKQAFSELRHNSYPNQWILYFFWPKDFTPVCASELRAFADIAPDFADRDCVLIGASTDSEFVHLAWCRFGVAPDALAFPMLADVKRELTTAAGILDPREGVAQRAAFLDDPGQIIRHASVNDFSAGRNPSELLRVLDALQMDALCPARWEKGQPVIDRPTAFIESMNLQEAAV